MLTARFAIIGGGLSGLHAARLCPARRALGASQSALATGRASMPHEDLLAARRAQLVRLFGPQAGRPTAESIQDWARDPFTATDQDQVASAHASAPDALVGQGPWSGRLVGIASECPPEFPGYVAGAIDAAVRGIRIVEGETS